jgi:hypothetical protein
MEGITMQEQLDEVTSLSRKVVIETKDPDVRPRISIKPGARRRRAHGRRSQLHDILRVISAGGRPAIGEPLLLGITKASLSTESFVSASGPAGTGIPGYQYLDIEVELPDGPAAKEAAPDPAAGAAGSAAAPASPRAFGAPRMVAHHRRPKRTRVACLPAEHLRQPAVRLAGDDGPRASPWDSMGGGGRRRS